MTRALGAQPLGAGDGVLAGRARVDWDCPRSWLGETDMANRVLAFDWANSPLGPIEHWPRSLKSAVAAVLRSRHQMSVCWGPGLTAIYNDAERDVLRDQHPWALGQSAREILSDAWDVLGPQFRAVMENGDACWAEANPLIRNRRGRAEVYYVTYSLSPLIDDNGSVGGVWFISEDVTARLLEQRRFATLRELRVRLVEALTVDEAGGLAASALTTVPEVPFALVYLIDESRSSARCAGASFASGSLCAAQETVELSSTAGPASALLTRLAADRADGALVEASMFVRSATDSNQTPLQAYAAPIGRAARDPVDGFLIAGVSDTMMFDDAFREFLNVAALGVARNVATVRERESEQRRAEAIAALERARTTVLDNASHELRTPLSLILGELELLHDNAQLAEPLRLRLGSIQRSAMRMLKLVNTLLDFSRLDAGERLRVFEPTDVAELTREVAAMFRSTAERAGLRLLIDCPSLPARIAVDRQGWEQIVCNLMSNALKFTNTGDIVVRTRVDAGDVVLMVEDTGIGIAESDLEQIFTRFYRGSDPRARTHEGSGIGLALVRELTRMHGGRIEATASPAGGTRMIVRIPRGDTNRVGEPVGEPTSGAVGRYTTLSVAEADGWLDNRGATTESSAGDTRDRTADRILVVEDNADMRAYLRRLLEPEFDVQVCRDGREACELALAHPPSLVVSDVMMPGLDGFDLIRELRSQHPTRGMPVILISARADPQSTLAALELGADDLISKPFGARELLARVRATLENTRVRSDAAAARARAGERARSRGELRTLVNDLKATQRRVAVAADAERRRIEQNLHDGAQQQLLAIRLELVALCERSAQHDPIVAAQLEVLRGKLDEALRELRELAHGLYPPLLESDGLEAAMRAAARRAAIKVTIDRCNVIRAPRSIESAVYFCCLEALQNATKHAGPGARASVALKTSDGALQFQVSDDGVGFDPGAVRHGFGLVNLADRVEALGGRIEVVSEPGSGTTIRGEIPLP